MSLGPRENGHRHSVDSLFRSAALSSGPDVIGIILTGTLGDGAAGLSEIKRAGGITIVQDPEEALFPGMPQNAIGKSKVDFILPLKEIVAKIIELVNLDEKKYGARNMNQDYFGGDEQLKADIERFKSYDLSSPRTLITCPECGGVLWENQDNQVLTY